jgi:hypothetical protein
MEGFMMKLNFDPAGNSPIIISFKTMRRMIGIFGMSLPLIAIFWTFVLSDCCTLLDSISAYYHTGMRDVFVGILCAVSFFLFAYHGYNCLDFITFKLAGLFSLGIAFFPTYIGLNTYPCIKICANQSELGNIIHFTSAALFFSTLAFTSIYLFTKFKPNTKKEDVTIQKKRRNVVYRVCGIFIILCLILIVIAKLLSIDSNIHRINPIFWLETIALFSFGVSWLVKGEVILKDA